MGRSAANATDVNKLSISTIAPESVALEVFIVISDITTVS
jgi:hypothetical protein